MTLDTRPAARPTPARPPGGDRTGWDLVVVGAGPAGASAAFAAKQVDPALRVLLLDREDFPRDKACGDGIAPHVMDLLAEHGAAELVEDLLASHVPVPRLRLHRDGRTVARDMRRPAFVIPRRTFDARLVDAAVSAGADLRRHRVRDVEPTPGGVTVDGVPARVVVAADGARSPLRRRFGPAAGQTALALRGYAPVPEARRGEQVIVFGTGGSPSYAWSFDRGDGLANVGYGEVLDDRAAPPTRAHLLRELDRLLPGATRDGGDWRGHHLPLSTHRWAPGRGRLLLVGDAAGLVNPMTGEGIYYAVATGLAAGRSAALALRTGDGRGAGLRYRRATRAILLPHLRHTAAAARLTRLGWVLESGLDAAARDQAVFDDLVELGLAAGRITPRLVRGLGASIGRLG
jgi:geranylgeranyl reductase family protein